MDKFVQVEVKITGPQGSGKTTAQDAIREALAEKFEIVNHVGSYEPDTFSIFTLKLKR